MSLKIVHISTSDTGGAGLAALRLHQALLDKNIESQFLCLRPTSTTKNIHVVPKFYPRFYHRLLDQLGWPITAGQKNERQLHRLQQYEQPEMFSFPSSDYRLHQHPLVTKADVIIVHWVAGFLDVPSFFAGLPKTKQVFWYTHDFNMILGGFHTLFDAQRFKTTPMQEVEHQLQIKKRRFLSAFPKLQLIANSQFSYETVMNAGVFKPEKIHCVPLGLPKDELKPIAKDLAKQALGFQASDLILLTVSAQLSSKLKGMDRLFAVLKGTDQAPPIKLLTLGSAPLTCDLPQVQITNFGSVWQPYFKQLVFSAADVLVSTSYEETFGQTIIEAYACETPVIVFNNGALPELVKQGKTGYVAEDHEDFVKYIQWFQDHRQDSLLMGQEARNHFCQHYTSERQVDELLRLFSTHN